MDAGVAGGGNTTMRLVDVEKRVREVGCVCVKNRTRRLGFAVVDEQNKYAHALWHGKVSNGCEAVRQQGFSVDSRHANPDMHFAILSVFIMVLLMVFLH